jgi:hypothetical protein
MVSASRSEETAKTVAVFTLLTFVVAAAGVTGPRTVAVLPSRAAAQAAQSSSSWTPSWQVQETRRLWDRDNGFSSLVVAPEAELGIPDIPGGRRVWHSGEDGTQAWGYVTEATAIDVGIAILDQYDEADGWSLISSEILDMSGTAWGGALVRKTTLEVVIFVALPKRLGEQPGTADNPTRVSILRIAGKEALTDVVATALAKQ